MLDSNTHPLDILEQLSLMSGSGFLDGIYFSWKMGMVGPSEMNLKYNMEF